MSLLPINITSQDKLLIIAPHPDDECIGVGGLLALFPKQCKVVVLTDGCQGQGDISLDLGGRIRKKEFLLEMRLAGIPEYELLNYPDGTLMNHLDCLENMDLSDITKIFVTDLQDNHPDHSAAYFSVAYLIRKLGLQARENIEVYTYEVHAALQKPTCMLDITEVIQKKIEYIAVHRSQIGKMPYDIFAKSMAEYRALQNRLKGKYIEVYSCMPILADNGQNFEIEKYEMKLQKMTLFYWILTRWLSVIISGKKITDVLKTMHVKKLAIYGYAELGKLLHKELMGGDIEVSYIIDQKINEPIMDDCPIYKLKKNLPDIDIVVVTAVYDFENIKETLYLTGYDNVISFRNLLDKC